MSCGGGGGGDGVVVGVVVLTMFGCGADTMFCCHKTHPVTINA